MAMDNLQLQDARSCILSSSYVENEDDAVVAFCLDAIDEGVLYAVTRTGVVHCFRENGKKVGSCGAYAIRVSFIFTSLRDKDLQRFTAVPRRAAASCRLLLPPLCPGHVHLRAQ